MSCDTQNLAFSRLLRKRSCVPREEELQSVAKQQQQLGLKDSRYICKADGVVRSEPTDEILILTTTSLK